MTLENFAVVLDKFINPEANGFREGKLIGIDLCTTHRTLQRLLICFAFGLIAGLAEQEYTDARNETAIQTARKIVQMLDKGKMPSGLYI